MQINNVGPISDATILPKPLTILIGEQPAAKTAAMYALAALVDWLAASPLKTIVRSRLQIKSACYLLVICNPFFVRRCSAKPIVRFLLRRLIFNASWLHQNGCTYHAND